MGIINISDMKAFDFDNTFNVYPSEVCVFPIDAYVEVLEGYSFIIW